MAKKTFKGVIKLDVRDSTPDWSPYTLPTAPKGAPNVLIILYDDTGLAAWSPFGGGINNADAAEARRQRPDVFAVAYDRALLADAFDVPDRAQPSPQRMLMHHRGRARLSWLERPHTG